MALGACHSVEQLKAGVLGSDHLLATLDANNTGRPFRVQLTGLIQNGYIAGVFCNNGTVAADEGAIRINFLVLRWRFRIEVRGSHVFSSWIGGAARMPSQSLGWPD